jgi:hypothetical protein
VTLDTRRGGVNQMWILKNSKDLLEYIQSRSLSSCNSIKTVDFSTLYTTIPHSNWKDKLKELVQLCFIKKNGQRRYKYLVLGRDRSYFVKHHSDSTKMFSETDIFNMLEFLIDNIFVIFGGHVFQQAVDIPMGTNCVPLLANLLLYSYEADFIQGLLKKNEKKLARSCNFTFHYIDDVLSLNNSRFSDLVDRIYPIELEIKDTTDTDRSASYLDLHLEIDSDGRLRTKVVVNTSRSFPHSRLITGFVTRITRRVPLVEQELLTLPGYLSSPPVFSGVHVTRSLVLYVCFVDRCLFFCTFSFVHCLVCSSSIYGF